MRVAGYVRLSRDEDKENYSSILSQKSIIEECVQKNNWTLTRYYEDDNYSGYSFDRPGFNDMIRDLENDMVDIIVAKDLSRIGRHNAYTLLFIDKVKLLGKRLILPKEGGGYDTALDESDLLGIKTWYNEMYVRDISKKIKSSLRAKQKEGRLIIKEHFGYIRSSVDKHRLEVDLEAADIVKTIFQLYLSGLGYRKIAEVLNNKGYPTPSRYIKQRYQQANIIFKGNVNDNWNTSAVQRILKNDIYIGTLRLAKTEKTAIKGKAIDKPIEQQYVFEYNHPAIVTRECFEQVQTMLISRKKTGSKGTASKENIFSGLLFCKACGSYMIAYNKAGKARSYICGSYHKLGSGSCKRHTVSEDYLMLLVKEYLKTVVQLYRDELCSISIKEEAASSENPKLLLENLKKEQEEIKEKCKLLIMQKISAAKKDNAVQYKNVLQQSFDELEGELQNRLIYIARRISELELLQCKVQKTQAYDAIQLIDKIINKPKLDKKDVEIFVERIIIDMERNAIIYFKGNTVSIC